MEFTKETVKYIAKLSKLEIDEDKHEAFKEDFIKIMDHFHNLADVKLEDVDINDLEGKKSVLRSDDVHRFEDIEALTRNAKTMRDGYIEIPKVVD
ncbi:Asp-tRNA(Asn)/Glu-tRNA(Gln) amidotransferase subunit GatC [Fusibacter sp. JL216-2]|uniref:Asp-tRNA(Asn)/Glu-tRNA(Gln) amidotransferase subunit GatC n=1 Tax=Fusibacter sp. JL216-2 TaxID=3071453 RepID=UPI003D32B33D